MTTPNTHSASVESPPANLAGQTPEATMPEGAARRHSGNMGSPWSNWALSAIGALAVVGLLVALFGAYLMEPQNVAVILIGAVIMTVAALVWSVVALIMVVALIRQMISSRGKKPRKPQPK